MGVNGKRDEKHHFSRKNKKNREENKGGKNPKTGGKTRKLKEIQK